MLTTNFKIKIFLPVVSIPEDSRPRTGTMHQNLRKALPSFTRKMKSKFQSNPKVKLILPFSFFFFFLLLLFLVCFILRSTRSSPQPSTLEETKQHSCNRIPPSLSQAIIHYSTSKDTPQQTFDEISVTARILEEKSPCNFLIFGLGHDSLMWASLNHGGHTVFLEEDKARIEIVRQKLPTLEAHHVVYNTKVSQADELLKYGRTHECIMVGKTKTSRCPLALKELPGFAHEIEWDLIMVDAPTAYFGDAPGRMEAMYTAGMMARGRMEGETHVFVHDVDRTVEDKFSKAFLCDGYLSKQEGKLRHFTIPSHMTTAGMPFCP